MTDDQLLAFMQVGGLVLFVVGVLFRLVSWMLEVKQTSQEHDGETLIFCMGCARTFRPGEPGSPYCDGCFERDHVR